MAIWTDLVALAIVLAALAHVIAKFTGVRFLKFRKDRPAQTFVPLSTLKKKPQRRCH